MMIKCELFATKLFEGVLQISRSMSDLWEFISFLKTLPQGAKAVDYALSASHTSNACDEWPLLIA